jgi:photosystem II stability/assembly factor-like uncharacterized protein
MKKLLPIFIFMFCAVISNAQWVEQVSGSTHWFGTCSFVDVNTGWICGTNGSDNMLVHTTDGGGTWTPQPLPVITYISEVFFLNSTTGWVVGNSGVLLKSTNNGETWTQQSIAFTQALQSVFFTDANKGWVVGQNGVIFHTTNGGTTWTSQASGTTNRLIKVRFLNDQTGWIVGWGGVILYTTNGGTTWTPQTSGTLFNLTGISIIDATHVVLTGSPPGGKDLPVWDNGIIMRTTDGGSSWTIILIPQDYTTNAVSFVNLNEGWIFGSKIMHSVDGGLTWQAQIIPISTQLSTGIFVDPFNGWAAGGDGVILNTNNKGYPVGINNPGNKNQGIRLANEPNPFTGNTRISYFVPEVSLVEISIYDICGKKIAELENKEVQAGNNTLSWDASSFPGGVYFCTMKAGAIKTTIKMILK